MRPKTVDTPGDQLTLELDAALPRLPAALRPMLARPASAPFDSARHLFEPAWGGRRALAFVEAAVAGDGIGGWLTADARPSVRLLDAHGRDLIERLPELRALSLRLEARSAMLDGELVAVDPAGRSDPRRMRARLGGTGDGPVAYLVFDLLYLDGRPLLAERLARRRELLGRVLRAGPEVVAVPAVEAEGIALHAAVAAQGLAGVRARVSSSPYLPGMRSALWRSIRADAGAGAAERPEAQDRLAAGGPMAPVLAVIRRLPLEDGAGGTTQPPPGTVGDPPAGTAGDPRP